MSNLASKNFIMPPEWHPHEGCLIVYPHNTGVFRSLESNCDLARAEVRNIARAICQKGKEHVFLLCNTQEEASELESILQKEDEGTSRGEFRIMVDVCPSDDSWCRDTGPTFVHLKGSSELVGLDWDFNAYGGPDEGCYWPCELDRKVAENIVNILSRRYVTSSTLIIRHPVKQIVLEGGSFHTDGEGTILTTEECLLNPNRNPQLSRKQIESILMEYLGAEKVIWLPHGVAFDEDTNGHVDNIATFSKPGEVVLSWTDDETDVNYARFQAAESVLRKELDAKGRSFKIHKLYIPKPMVRIRQDCVLVSYKHSEIQKNTNKNTLGTVVVLFVG
jgi:Peptidylarginine deiminase and related enzymes